MSPTPDPLLDTLVNSWQRQVPALHAPALRVRQSGHKEPAVWRGGPDTEEMQADGAVRRGLSHNERSKGLWQRHRREAAWG